LTDEDFEGFEDVRPPPPAEFMLTPSKEVREATFTLLYDGEFAGTAVAVGPRLVITAGHHFKVSQQDVGLLTLHNAAFVSKRKQGVGIAYVQKDQGHDLLLLWPKRTCRASACTGCARCPERGWRRYTRRRKLRTAS
jgi:hypothetical protein